MLRFLLCGEDRGCFALVARGKPQDASLFVARERPDIASLFVPWGKIQSLLSLQERGFPERFSRSRPKVRVWGMGCGANL
jgi:hypothetical protein